MQRTGCLLAAAAVVVVLGIPLMILLALDPGSSQACGAAPAGPGPATVAGIPTQLLPIFEGAAQQFQLGSDGWAYLAALNDAESTFGTSQLPGVHSGANSAGAAGPMQIGIGGAATNNWGTYEPLIPPNLSGGAEPPSVYNEVDAVYAAAAKLSHDGAPGSWQAALIAWNDYPPEIAQVTQLVAQYTTTGQGQPGQQTAGATSTTRFGPYWSWTTPSWLGPAIPLSPMPATGAAPATPRRSPVSWSPGRPVADWRNIGIRVTARPSAPGRNRGRRWPRS